MLGSLLVSKFQLDVMSRANIEPEKREPFRLYVDEFQNFATDSFSDIFSEAHKYGLSLVIAHQYVNQVSNHLMDAIMGNVGNMAVFHIGSSDARMLAPNIASTLTPQTLIEQPLYNFTLKTTQNGKKEIHHGELIHPNSLPLRSSLQSAEKLQTVVREKFAQERSFVEGKINRKVD
jgi:type IV secretory pathway TraG/TraD family ATPase VirD4